MAKKIKALLIGESWVVHVTETKGFDVFTADRYEVGTEFIEAALTTDDIEFIHMPCHRIEYDFPQTVEELLKYDVIIISDCGANTFLLPAVTFVQCNPSVNKLMLLQQYVQAGGGLCMAGGYLSFMGIEGKGRYNDTPIEEILPVNFLKHDDRREHPEGLCVTIDPSVNEIFSGVGEKIEGILGYNKAIPKQEAKVLATFDNGDPYIVLGTFGKGRSIAYTTDCAPHWSSPALCRSENYRILWQNMVRWLANS